MRLKYFFIYLIVGIAISCVNKPKTCSVDVIPSKEKEVVFSSRFPNYMNTPTGVKFKILKRLANTADLNIKDIAFIDYKIFIDANTLYKSSVKEKIILKDDGFVLPRLANVLIDFKVGDSVNIFIPQGYYSAKDGVDALIQKNDVMLSLKINEKLEKYISYDATTWKKNKNGIKISSIYINPKKESFSKGEKVEMYYAVYLAKGNKNQLVESNFNTLKPIQFTFGEEPFIAGLNYILEDVKKGDRYKVFIPSAYAYGEKGTNVIPSNADLVFDIYFPE